jgi:hypothetical protein
MAELFAALVVFAVVGPVQVAHVAADLFEQGVVGMCGVVRCAAGVRRLVSAGRDGDVRVGLVRVVEVMQ